jgi:transcriptional regulator with XRE-family HTH domain
MASNPKVLPASSPPEILRFAEALRRAMIQNQCSERKLASELGITIGTTQKYFRGLVHPLKVATGINHRLAAMLNTSLDELVNYYITGEHGSEISFEQVVAWLNSKAGAEHLAPVLFAASNAARGGTDACAKEKKERFTWPLEELAAAKVSPALRGRMGLTDEALEALCSEGVFDDELVEAFSIATNLDEGEVRKAFANRLPIPQ